MEHVAIQLGEAFDPDAMPPWLAELWPTDDLPESVIAGVNDDDCAVMSWGSGVLAVTTDFLNSSPIAIQQGIGDLGTLGRLVVAANLADLLGSGAMPQALLTAVTMPRNSRTEDFKTLMKGVKFEADRWDVPVIGGDSKLGDSLAVLGVAIGSAPSSDCLFLKNSAKAGDLLWASGPLGSVSAAVLGLSHR